MTKITINLNVKNYNGGPKVRVYTEQKTLFDSQITKKGLCTIEFDTQLSLPNKVTIQHYDKNMKRDTLVQADGRILDDKGFFVESVKIDDVLLLHELFHFELIKDDGEIIKKSNYLGFNSKFVIDLDTEDLYNWYSGWQKILASDQEIFSYDKFKEEIFADEPVSRKVVY